MRELRQLLRDAARSAAGGEVFTALYSCWSHSAGVQRAARPHVQRAARPLVAKSLSPLPVTNFPRPAPNIHRFSQQHVPAGAGLQPRVRPGNLPRTSTHTLNFPHAGALISLCLLAQAYSHVSDLVDSLAGLDIGAETLVQVRRCFLVPL